MNILNLFAFLLGACVGSFINVCAWRLPRNESIVSPPSHCPKCGHEIEWFENIPIFSWFMLNARCSCCKQPISPRYVIVESLTALLFLAISFKAMQAGSMAPFLPYAAVMFLLIATFIIDVEHMIIPDELTYPTMICGLVFAALLPENWGVYIYLANKHMPMNFPSSYNAIAFSASLISLVAAAALSAALAFAGKSVFKAEALGMGDVKYLAAVGACIGLPACFFAVLFGSITGSLYGLYLVSFRKAGMKTAIPFGPFLSAGTLIWLLSSDWLIRTYIDVSLLIAEKLSG